MSPFNDNLNQAEEEIMKYYRKQGFKVENIGPANTLLEHKINSDNTYRIKRAIENELENTKDVGEVHTTKGVPDLIVYRKRKNPTNIEISNIFFVEVKKPGDSLRLSQIRWMSKFSGLESKLVIPQENESPDVFDLNMSKNPKTAEEIKI